MKRLLPLTLFWVLLYASPAFAQLPPPCDGRNGAGDEPPGCLICGPVYQGTTAPYSPGTPGPFFPCGSIENNQWLSFIAGQANISATIIPSDCVNNQGVQLLIYDQNLVPVSTCFSAGTAVPGNVSASGLTPGEIYWIMIDGFAGDICEFTIIVQGGILTVPPDPPGPITANPNFNPVCPNQQICYSVPPVNGATDYEWVIPDNGVIVSGDGTNQICVIYDEPGGGVICVTPSNQCFPGVPSCLFVLVQEIPPTIKPPVWFCPEEFPVEVDGNLFPEPGSFEITYITPKGCDSVVTYILLEYINIPGRLDTFFCKGGFVDVHGTIIDTIGVHEVVLQGGSRNGCDSVIFVRATEIAPFASVAQPRELDCNRRDTVLIDGSNSSSGPDVTYSWASFFGGSMVPPLNQNSVQATSPGTYVLTVRQQRGAVICIDRDTVVVRQRTVTVNTPTFSAGETSLCQGTPGTYTITPVSGAITYIWTVPAGATFTGTGLSIVVDFGSSMGGDVCVIAEGPCGRSQPACIPVTINPVPTSDFTVVSPICQTNTTTLQYTGTGSPFATYTWTYGSGTPANATGPGPHNIRWATPGIKTVTLVVEENGCTSPETRITVDVQPTLQAPVISCDATQTTVTFNWSTVANANDYTVYINGANVGTQGGTSYLVTGLNPGDNVDIRVVANTNSICGPSEASASCVAQDCPVVDLNLQPVADICFDANSSPIQLVANPTGGLGGGSSLWSGPGVSPTGMFDPRTANVGRNTISFTYTELTCVFTGTIDINVFEIPRPEFTVTSPICNNRTSTITYTGNATVGGNYTWDFAGGTIQNGASGAGPYQIQWATGGNYNVTLEIEENGCRSVVGTQVVQVDEPLPQANVLCDQTTTSVTFSWDPVPGATSYTVNSGAGGTFDPANRTYFVDGLNPGDMVTIEVVAEGTTVCGPSRVTVTCEASNCPPDRVLIDPIGPFCKDGNQSVVNLNATMENGDNSGTFTWSGPGTTPDGTFNPNSGAVGTGTITIRSTYTKDNCTYQGTYDITIHPQPDANFSIEGPICVDNTSTIQYTGTAGSGATFDWTFSPGTAQSGSGAGPYEVKWNTAGNQNVSLIVTENNCASELETKLVQVDARLAKPLITCTSAIDNIEFSWDPIAGASGYTVNVLSGSTGTYAGGVNYTVGGLSPNDRVTIEVVANGATTCGPTRDTLECIARSCPPIDLVIPPVSPICLDGNAGNVDLAARLVVNGSSGNRTQRWNDGSGGNAYITIGGVFFPNAALAGIHRVCVDWEEPSGSGCVTTQCSNIEVVGLPSFSTGITSPLCVGDTADAAIVTGSTRFTYTWDFSNGTVLSGSGGGPYRVVWNDRGVDTVTIVADDKGCISTQTRTVRVEEPLQAPVIDCNSTNTSIDFSWNAVAGATDYEISFTGGHTPSVQTNLSLGFAGLVPETEITMTLTVYDSLSPCPPAVISHTCKAKECPQTVITINPVLDTCLVTGVTPNIQLGATIVNDPGNGSGLLTWSGQNVSASGLFTPNRSGNFQALVTYEYDGCTYTGSRTIRMYQTPTASIEVETPICETGTSTIRFNGTPPTNGIYRWDFGTGTTVSGTGGGPYEIRWPAGNGGQKPVSLIVEANGCVSQPANSTVQVDVPLAKPVLRCDDYFSTTSAEFFWDAIPGATEYEVFINGVPRGRQATTSYLLTGQNAGAAVRVILVAYGNTVCPPTRDTLLCRVDECPTSCLKIDPVDPICLNTASSLFLISEDTCNYNGTGVWSGPGVNATGLFNPIAAGAGIQTLTYTYDFFGECQVSESIDIEINTPPVADAGADKNLDCINTSVALGGNSSNVGFYEWTLNGNVVGRNRNLTVSQGGTYTLTVEDLFTGCRNTDQVFVDDSKTAPVLFASLDSISCFGRNDGVIRVDSVRGGEPQFLYSLNGSPFAQQAHFSNLGAGNYTLIMQDVNGCQDTVGFSVTEPDDITVELKIFDQNGLLLDGTQPINLGDSVTLEALSNYAPELLSAVTWTPVDVIPLCDEININNCLTVAYSPTGQTIFTVRIENKNGCAAEDNGQVNVKKIRPVYIPSGFSPNNVDGTNDLFRIYADPRVAINVKSFMVFDRWGEPVFEAYNFQPCADDSCTVGWDGTFRNKKFNSGVFVYFAEIEFFDGVVEIFKGDVTIK